MTPNQPTKEDVRQLFVQLDRLDIKALRAYIDLLEMEVADAGRRLFLAVHYPEEGYSTSRCETELANAEHMLGQARVMLGYRLGRSRKEWEADHGP